MVDTYTGIPAHSEWPWVMGTLPQSYVLPNCQMVLTVTNTS